MTVGRVLLFGELCGGRYPHPDVPPDPRVEAVQTGVWYSPTVEFYAFDIALELHGGRINEASHDSLFFLDFDKVGQLAPLFIIYLLFIPIFFYSPEFDYHFLKTSNYLRAGAGDLSCRGPAVR